MFFFNFFILFPAFVKAEIFASGSDDGFVKIWSAYTNLRTLGPHFSPVMSLEFFPKFILACGLKNQNIFIWDWFNSSLIRNFSAHNGAISDLLNINNNLLISCSTDSKIKIWNMTNFYLIKTINHEEPVIMVRYFESYIFSLSLEKNFIFIEIVLNSEIRLIYENNKIGKYDVYAEKLSHVSDRAIKIFENGRLVQENNNQIESPEGTVLFKDYLDLNVNCIELIGERFIAAWNSQFKDFSIHIFHETNGSIYRKLTGHTDAINKIKYLKNGKNVSSKIFNQDISELVINAQSSTKIIESVSKSNLSNLNTEHSGFMSTFFTSTSQFTSVSKLEKVKYIDLSLLPKKDLLLILSDNNDLTDCLLNCTNRGACILLSNNKFACECNKNFVGSSCQFDIRPCSSSPCLNNGTCIDKTSRNMSDFNQSYICECRPYYNGTNCEHEIDLCKNKACSKQGYCFQENHEAKCKCFKSYNGDECQIESNENLFTKYFVKATLIISICVICFTFLTFMFIDLFNIFMPQTKRSYRKTNEKRLFKKYFYQP
ncbi:unnamed protein product [Brachionus calyciflorus]|uniref:EGF-like domain-containing protein n=1 Tax=Brachionus calyciflorus TaxID=104777 RepID=A0A813V2W9_9BILA|nr:unnamed protein product [Brachionus calyciflorus]